MTIKTTGLNVLSEQGEISQVGSMGGQKGWTYGMRPMASLGKRPDSARELPQKNFSPIQ